MLTFGISNHHLSLLIELVNENYTVCWIVIYFRLDKEFHGFQRLFTKYLETDVDTSIDWEKIEKLPADSVSQLYQLKPRYPNFYFKISDYPLIQRH